MLTFMEQLLKFNFSTNTDVLADTHRHIARSSSAVSKHDAEGSCLICVVSSDKAFLCFIRAPQIGTRDRLLRFNFVSFCPPLCLESGLLLIPQLFPFRSFFFFFLLESSFKRSQLIVAKTRTQ